VTKDVDGYLKAHPDVAPTPTAGASKPHEHHQ
jgi:hypothetical protein